MDRVSCTLLDVAACISTVAPWMLRYVVSAPRSIRSFAISSWPRSQAASRGVDRPHTKLTSAPRSRRRRARGRAPLKAARPSAEGPSGQHLYGISTTKYSCEVISSQRLHLISKRTVATSVGG